MKKITNVLFGVAAAASVALAAAPAALADEMHWHGEVDDTATISIHRHDIKIDADMKGVRNEHHAFRGELHRGVAGVRLVGIHGRGHVWIVQQPGPDNHFTAVVRIKDPDAGAGKYDFTLQW